MSGCSGGPVILHEFKNGLFRWYPVGIINRSPRGGDFGIDIIRVRRLNLLAPDGQ
jgi:hypothetical protein